MILDAHEPGVADALFSAPFGLFGRQKIKAMIGRKLIRAELPLELSQLQPASLDLRLSKEAYRVRASFLPGRERTVRDRLKSLNAEPVSLAGKGAVLEKGIVYVARLMERLELRPNLSGAANPKSSTGRIDIFTRLIVDGGEAFDDVPLDYKGELWLEISPRSFSVRVKAGTKLNQVRFRSRHSNQIKDKHTFALDDAGIRKRHSLSPLVDGELELREGLVLRVDLGGLGENVVGYRAIKNSDVIDVNRLRGYAMEDFWEPIYAGEDRRLILDPDQFYILASREKVQIPSDLAAEMAPIPRSPPPPSFSVRVKAGTKLNQVRFRSRHSNQIKDKHTFALDDAGIRKRHSLSPLVDGELELREGLVLRVDLGGLGENVVGYRAIKNSDVIDVNRLRGYAMEDFWEPIYAGEDRRLILDPDQFYILASREKVQIPSDLAAEMAPIDPAIGEFRVHYAGFFDPGFGQGKDGRPSARAVLEVRSRDVPFLLEDSQPVGRLVYEKLAGLPDALYGADATSNYQHQGLKLSKHFRA